MASSTVVTLFSEANDPHRQPVTVAVSAVVHVAVIALVFFGILTAPKIDTRVADRYTVRTLDFHMPPPPPMRRAANKIDYPGAHHPNTPAPAHPAGGSAPPPPQTAKVKMGPQTILQPDLAKQLALKEEVPVPKMVIWSPPVKVVQKIVAPPPKLTAAETKALLEALNHEANLADVNVASSLAKTAKLPMMPSTTTPLTVHGPKLPQAAPSTVSQTTAPPSPAAILAASDLLMNEGTTELPPVNESALADLPVTRIDPGLSRGNGAGSGTGKNPGAGQGSAAAGPAHSAASANGLGNQDTATQVTLPRNGVFGAVVVGAALQDQFPELADLWNGRMAYTVYLHVGLARSWILEYSLPGTASAALGANGERLEAPWPYSIVRPNLGPSDINADALMVHGFVNQAGQFEALSVVFPTAFPQAQFVLQSLAHWQFRPATQNGRNARVEVLLIIPEEMQ
jgi:hypothetical protein